MIGKINKSGKLTPRQKELIKELWNSWAEFNSDDVKTTNGERIKLSFGELWQPYYVCIHSILGTDYEKMISNYMDTLEYDDSRKMKW